MNENKRPEGTRREGPPFPVNSRTKTQQCMAKILTPREEKGGTGREGGRRQEKGGGVLPGQKRESKREEG